MAVPTYAINGSSAFNGVQTTWTREPATRNADGGVIFSLWARHIWRIALLDVTAYLTLQNALTTPITTLNTNDIDDRNNGTLYTNIRLLSVSGSHIGRNVQNVRVEFRIKTDALPAPISFSFKGIAARRQKAQLTAPSAWQLRRKRVII